MFKITQFYHSMLANMLMCPNSNIKTLSRPNNLLRTLLQKDLGYTLMYIFLIVLVVNNSRYFQSISKPLQDFAVIIYQKSLKAMLK